MMSDLGQMQRRGQDERTPLTGASPFSFFSLFFHVKTHWGEGGLSFRWREGGIKDLESSPGELGWGGGVDNSPVLEEAQLTAALQLFVVAAF